MASKTDEDDEIGEKETLLNKKDEIRIEITKDDIQAKEAAQCERLIKARKSLTRSQPIDETEYPVDAGPISAIPEEVESDAESEKLPSDDEVPLDSLSASLSGMPMERFALEKRRVSKMLPRSINPTFVDPSVENLFQLYHERQRRGDMHLMFFAGLLISICSAYLLIAKDPQTYPTTPTNLLCVFGVIHIVFLCFMCSVLYKFIPERILAGSPYFVWIINTIELALIVTYNPINDVSPRHTFIWLLVLVHLTVAALPLRLTAAIFLSKLTAAIYIILFYYVNYEDTLKWVHIISVIFMVAGSMGISIMSYFFADKKHRRAFLETRQSLEVKMVIEEQSKEQERLLLSVLPKHVAETMRQDLGGRFDSQFKKIYMSRHENVSILFADIVGFTAISSTYTASELVKMLNELFARFDGLAEKYKQLRIKILGDCYYCISGAPKERSDHAILCVHMGLSMIDAIRYVRENTGCGVDMRVGIHTGAVLAGVLGQRQWQFDVYSKDVILANKMESSGKPGRVHVSNTTKDFLEDHFEIEPAYGERREDALRAASLKTYFIAKVLIPHKARPSLGLIKNGAKNSQPSKDQPNDVMISRDSVTMSTQEEGGRFKSPSDQRQNSFTKKLQRELVSRDRRKDLLNKISPVTLTFRDQKAETAYRKQREAFTGAAVTALPLIVFVIFITRFIAVYRTIPSVVVFSLGFLFVILLTTVPAARSFPLPVCECLLKMSKWIHSNQLRRSFWFTLLMAMSACIVLVDIYLCHRPFDPFVDNEIEPPISMPALSGNETAQTAETVIASDYDNEDMNAWRKSVYDESLPANCTYIRTTCTNADYYGYFMLLILIASSLLAQMNYIAKGATMFTMAFILCFLVVSLIKPYLLRIFPCQKDYPMDKFWLTGPFVLSIELLLSTLLLILLNRQMEKASRILYLWRQEIDEQKERAEEIRQRNEALVYNILPPHVATHFLGMSKKKHEELYSQSYDEVGVLFASMPNYGDFYSEESVNNQGLECLRFLNEVISDFDGLLERPQYCDIVKIKTIASTYMASSGLNPSRQVKKDDPVTVRWAHLSLLVDFAFELINTLQLINEQSFNHFVLRMGINHGPITAGVIGARKPHYDIWGNTVNVASRMESTGKAGCIQVTEETSNILRQFGYKFEQRGVINVKGKGELMTYYLVGKPDIPIQANGKP